MEVGAVTRTGCGPGGGRETGNLFGVALSRVRISGVRASAFPIRGIQDLR